MQDGHTSFLDARRNQYILCRQYAQLENTPDDMDEDQSMPDDLEVSEPALEPHRTLPQGTSDYQACWILDEQDAYQNAAEPATVDHSSGRPGAFVGGNNLDDGSGAADEDLWESKGADTEADDEAMYEETGEEEENASPEEVAELKRQRQQQAAKDDLVYPDEVDTPQKVPARVRAVIRLRDKCHSHVATCTLCQLVIRGSGVGRCAAPH